MEPDAVIEASKLPRLIRKNVIVENFELLNNEEHFLLIHEHDPQPLKMYFEKEFPGRFEWKYLKKEPGDWQIRISKVEKRDFTLNELIKSYPNAIHVLEKNGIAYYMDGNKNLSECCKNKNYEAPHILQQINGDNCGFYFGVISRVYEWDIPFLIDYILVNHHKYTRKVLPELSSLIGHIVTVHGTFHPGIVNIQRKFEEFKEELEEHLKEEENVIFPALKKISLETDEDKQYDGDDVKYSLSWMKEDHILTITSMKALNTLCDHYHTPGDAYPAYKVLMHEMQKFESDLHLHLHLENNILFNKAKELVNFEE